MIAIVNYGLGNLGSIENMLRKVGVAAKLASSSEDILASDKLILPGVGAFDEGMAQLTQRGLIEPLRRKVLEQHTPVLGICLGMQLLTEGSAEGHSPGLGFLRARAHRFDFAAQGLKVPHMGWNTLKVCKPGGLFATPLEQEQRFYFVHSYYVTCDDQADMLATTEYGLEFVSAFQRSNIYGVQFHPEKSHRFGMSLLRRFAEA